MANDSTPSTVSTTTDLHAPPELAPSSPSRITIDVPSRVVVKVLLLIAVFAVAVNIVTELQGLLVQIAIACFLAVAADPLVRRLQRAGFGRGRAVLTVMLGAFAMLALIVAVFVPPLVEQGDRFITAAPDIVDDVRASSWYQDIDERFDVIGKASEQAEKLPGIVGDQLGSLFGAVAAGVLGTLTILFLVVFLLMGGGQLVTGTVRLFPKVAERRWWNIVQGAYSGIAAYVGGAIIIALCGGTVLTITAVALDLPYALPLGLWMMLLEIIPMIGATIGAVPAIIVAFVAGGMWQGIVMIIIVVVYQQIENILIQPRVQGRAASLSPLIVFLSVLVGSQLLGVLGALFAVPVAGVIQIFLRQLIDDHGSGELQVPRIASAGLPEAPDVDNDGEPGVANDPSD
jgi:predicted PurR-regulated permease PerM